MQTQWTVVKDGEPGHIHPTLISRPQALQAPARTQSSDMMAEKERSRYLLFCSQSEVILDR